MDNYDRLLAQAAQAVDDTFNHPHVFVPIDHNGNECGPPEVCYRPPSGTALN